MMGKIGGRKVFYFLIALTAIIPVGFSFQNILSGDSTVHPVTGTAIDAIYSLGTIKSDSVQTIKAGVPGRVIRRHVREGDTVSPGSPVITTDSAVLTSSISGVITRLSVNENDTLLTGSEIARITDISRLYVLISLDQRSILAVREGMPAEISFDGLRSENITGRVLRSYPSPESSQFLARIDAEKFPDGVLPEMTCDVALETGRRTNAVFVPKNALREGFITFIRNDKVIRARAETGAVKDDLIEIRKPVLTLMDRITVNN